MPQIKSAPRPARRKRAQRSLLKRILGLFGLKGVVVLFVILGVGGSWYLWAPQKNPIVFVSQHFKTLMADKGFRLRHIYVDGRYHCTLKDIKKAIGAPHGAPIFSIDLDQAYQRLKALPWVETVQISRHLPDTILIQLKEREPLALWQHQHRLFLIDQKGQVIKGAQLRPFQSLVVLVGQKAPQLARALLSRLDRFPAIEDRVTAAICISGRRWDLMIDNAIKVKLPEDGLNEALIELQKLHTKKILNPEKILAVDMRLKDRAFFYLLPASKGKSKKLRKV